MSFLASSSLDFQFDLGIVARRRNGPFDQISDTTEQGRFVT